MPQPTLITHSVPERGSDMAGLRHRSGLPAPLLATIRMAMQMLVTPAQARQFRAMSATAGLCSLRTKERAGSRPVIGASARERTAITQGA